MRIALLTVLLALVRLAAAAPLFWDDFESGNATGWSAVYQKGDGARLTIEKTQHWSGNYAAKVTIANPFSTLQLEGTFVSAPKIYLRTALYIDPSLNLPVGQWIAIFGPANVTVGVLDRISLTKRSDGRLILNSQSCGDGRTPLVPGEWITLETMYAPGDGNGETAFWVNGELQQSRADLVLKSPANSVAAGALQFSWDSNPSGVYFLDDVEVSEVRGGALQPQCTLHFPDLRGRAGARILTVLSGWKSGWRFSASLSGDGLPSQVIHENSALQEGAIYFPMEISKLSRGTYIITAVLEDQSGGERARWTGSFEKNYDHEARLTLDSNNNVTLDAKPFFPVTPFGLPEERIAEWAGHGYINCLYGQNWWQPTVETMRNYAAVAAQNGIPTFGPLNLADQNARDTALVSDHVLAAKNNPNIVGYTFVDEPDYNGNPEASVREWWQTAKRLDGSRLVHLNLMGSDFLGASANLKIGKRWTYPNLFADIYGFDMYPMWKPNFSIANLGDAADNLLGFNRGLIPFFAFVQTCNVEPTNPVSRAPTPEELRVMAWVLVVHGAKGIQWYHYGSGTSDECYAAMAKFTSDITEFTTIVLSSLPAPATDCAEAKGQGASIHVMSRQYAGKTYLFAVNATAATKSFRCALAGLRSGSLFGIASSEETIAYGESGLEDTLPPYGVRIYYTKKPAPPTNLKALSK